jgi:hypothetical protein
MPSQNLHSFASGSNLHPERLRRHGFPAWYRAAVEAVPAVVDPDPERAAANWKMVNVMNDFAPSGCE